MQLDCLEQFEGPLGQEDPSRVKIRHRVRQMLSDVPAEENKALLFKGTSDINAVKNVLDTFTFM